MDWIKVVLFICIILQQVEIIYLSRRMTNMENIIAAGIMEKFKILTSKDDEDKNE